MNTPAPNPSETVMGGSRRPLIIRPTIAAVAVLFLSMVAVIFYRSWVQAPPMLSSVLTVQADESWNGTALIVEGAAVSLSAKFGRDEGYQCMFRLPPGFYRLKMRSGGEIARLPYDVVIRDQELLQMKLKPRPTSGPARR